MAENFAPYAPAVSVLHAIDHHRERGLVNPVTVQSLERISIPTSMASRTLAALRFLGLVDEQGNHLPAFDLLRRATTDEFPGQLGELVQSAYLQVFTSVDPATADDIRLADAFRGYEPAAQRTKMIILFRALCERAGLMNQTPRKRSTVRQERPQASPRPKVAAPATAHVKIETFPPDVSAPARKDYRMVSAVFEQLPLDGKWTSERRAKWIQAMTAAVDLLVDVADSGVEAT